MPLPKQQCSLSQYTAGYIDTETDAAVPTLLFLHGFFGSSANWERLIARLSDGYPDRYRCVALDLLGFGDSSKPWLKYTIWHQVDFVTEFIAALGLTNVTLVGHSYGGWTAAAYAVRQATQADETLLQGLVLVAPAGIRDDSFVGRYSYMKPLLWESSLVDRAIALLKPMCTLLNRPQFYQRIAEARKALTEQPVAKSFLVDRLRPEDAIDTVDKDIHAIQVPTVVVAAAQDDTIPLWHCETYANRIPHARLVVLPDAKHDLIQTHGDAIAAALHTIL